MPRLCERPGCGEAASVSYGFDSDRSTVWLEALLPDGPGAGALCRRHADAMVLPKGWWLQDRRSDATLFTAPEPAAPRHGLPAETAAPPPAAVGAPAARPAGRRRRTRPRPTGRRSGEPEPSRCRAGRGRGRPPSTPVTTSTACWRPRRRCCRGPSARTPGRPRPSADRPMDLHASLDAPCPPAELFSWVDDLSRYPQWLSIVTRAEPDGDAGLVGRPPRPRRAVRPLQAAAHDPHHAWSPTISSCSSGRARRPPPLAVGAARRGRRRRRRAAGSTCACTTAAALWGSVLERMLGDEIDQSRARLLELVSGRTR